MRHLYLMRHAKAKQPHGEMTDHQRPLRKRGERQAEAMAQVLQRWQALEGEIFVSTAARTRQTFDVIEAQHLEHHFASHVLFDDALYTFEGDALLEWLKVLPDKTERVLVIGHNPALIELARWLNDEAPHSLPTGSVLYMTLPDTPWKAIAKGEANLEGGITPETASFPLFQRTAPKPPTHQKRTASRVRDLLEYQYQMVRALEPGVIAGMDPEFLHQYRVNLRRSRAVGESVLAITKVPGLKKMLKRLKQRAQATSDLRDLDVLLEELAKNQPPLSTDTRQHLRQWLQHCRQAQRQTLGQQLRAPGYVDELESWQRYIASDELWKALSKLTCKRIQAVLNERITRHNEALAALSPASPDTELHDLRKGVKRIRYLADLNPALAEPLLVELKRRQSLLGDYQDLCSRQAWLDAFNAGVDIPQEQRKECSQWQAALETQKQKLRKKVLALPPLVSH